MGLFKLRKNKRYSYSGRFNEEKLIDGSTHQKYRKIKSKFDEYRSTIGDNNSFRDKFRLAINDYKRVSDLIHLQPFVEQKSNGLLARQ